MYGSDYWNRIINFQALADEGVVADDHLKLIHFADTPEAGVEARRRVPSPRPVNDPAILAGIRQGRQGRQGNAGRIEPRRHGRHDEYKREGRWNRR